MLNLKALFKTISDTVIPPDEPLGEPEMTTRLSKPVFLARLAIWRAYMESLGATNIKINVTQSSGTVHVDKPLGKPEDLCVDFKRASEPVSITVSLVPFKGAERLLICKRIYVMREDLSEYFLLSLLEEFERGFRDALYTKATSTATLAARDVL